MPGQEGEDVLWMQQSAEFRSGKPMVARTPCFLPLSSACVTHIDGNNFFQLLTEVGEACSLQREGLSLSCSPLRSVLAAESGSSIISFPHLPLWTGVLPFQFLCFGVFPHLLP